MKITSCDFAINEKSDYTVHWVGFYNENTGQISALQAKKENAEELEDEYKHPIYFKRRHCRKYRSHNEAERGRRMGVIQEILYGVSEFLLPTNPLRLWIRLQMRS